MRIDIYRVGLIKDLHSARRYLTLPASRFPAALDPPVTWRWRISRAATAVRNSIRTIRRHIRRRQWRDLRNTLVGWRAEPTPFPETGIGGCGYGLTRNGALIRLAKRVKAADERQFHPDHLALLILIVQHLGEKPRAERP